MSVGLSVVIFWIVQVSALLIFVRRCDPLSSPFVYQDPSARSLLITQRSRPRGLRGRRVDLARRDVAEAVRENLMKTSA